MPVPAKIKNIFLPNRAIDRAMSLGLVAFWVAVGFLVWLAVPFDTLPKPGEVWSALGSLWWEHGMGPELFTTLRLILHALFLTLVISMLLSYATVLPFFRPLVEAVSKLRFLGLTGLVVPFTLVFGGGYDLKVALLTFGMTTFFVTGMAQVVVDIPREQFDHMRVMGASELRILWEVVVRGTLDKALDITRQNLAIGWALITMVEGISRAEGGLGAMILNQNKHFLLAEVYAILFVILFVGLLLDYGVGVLTRMLCPYAELEGAPVIGDVLLEVRDVSQRLGNHQILDKLTFTVHDRTRPGVVTGQLVALLGPSGVGKTRLLRLIAGLDRPDTGVVLGTNSQPMDVGSVGFVFQNYLLLRHRTVMGNLVTAGVANGMPRKEAKDKASHLLERFGLADRGTYYPAQLSGGQRQRVAIAQQLIHQKSLLVMDEPFSGLDPIALENVIKLMNEVAHMDELNTLIVVTHDIRAALLVSDTLLMLGRDRAPDGKPVPGARIQHTYDLVERGMAWRPNLELDPQFPAIEREIKERFRVL